MIRDKIRLTSNQHIMLMDINDERGISQSGPGLRTLNTLIEKGLVSRAGTETRVYLTDRGAKWLCNRE